MATKGNPIMVLAGIERRSKTSSELLSRLNNYGRAFQSLVNSKDAKLIVFVTYVRKSTEVELQHKFEYLEICSVKIKTWRLLRQSRLLLRLIKCQGKGSHLLIAGHPIFGFLISLLVKLQSRVRHSIQVQFHGDIYLRPQSIKAKEYFRWMMARIQFDIADSTRVVSEHQSKKLFEISNGKSKEIVIGCVPIDPIYFSADLTKPRVSIGFIGRLHVERGVEMLREIVACLLSRHSNIQIHIIGDGPEKGSLEQQFRNEAALGKISFLGWLTKEAVIQELETMKILISTAPREGYGLAIREAVLAGVQVVANSSHGANFALRDFPEHVTLYHDSESAIFAIESILETRVSIPATIRARKLQLEKDKHGIETLVRSWS